MRELYALMFVGLQHVKEQVSGSLLLIYCFTVYRKIYKIFHSQRGILDERLKFDICHQLIYEILGLEVGDNYLKKNLDLIFKKIDLVSRKEKKIEEAERKKKELARQHRKKFFIVT
jgi:hypothetical protein